MINDLTIGLPCYDDYEGVYFSVQALRMYHPGFVSTENLLIVDNNPQSSQGLATKQLADSQGIKYIPFERSHGPANSKNLVFENAETDYVLCMDSHVFIDSGALYKLIEYYKKNPGTKDLIHGPLLYDDLKTVSTHFDMKWRGDMWGIWATDDRGKDASGEPFEIPAQGMGLFSCRRDAWLGFNKSFVGFGGEEGYIHEKFRQAGGKIWCLPFLRWLHRFNRPLGVKYPLILEERIRNYLIGHTELGLPIEQVVDHFSKEHPNINITQIIEHLDDPPKSRTRPPLSEQDKVQQPHDNIQLWESSEVNLQGVSFRYLKYKLNRSYDGYGSLMQMMTIPQFPANTKIHSFSSEDPYHPARSILTENGSWVTSDETQGKMPHEVIIDFGTLFSPLSLSTLPRPGLNRGIPVDFKIYSSSDLTSWEEISHVNILGD